MKLYLISQNVNNLYDTYDSCIVAANNEDDARMIVPCTQKYITKVWAEPKYVKVKLIGTAELGIEAGIILSSFNAG